MGRLSVLFFLLVLLSSCSNGTIPTNSYFFGPGLGSGLGSAPPRYDLEHDMFLPNEGYMYSPDWDLVGGGITSYSWYWKANFNYLTKEPQTAGHGFDRIVAWGQVVASRERPTPNIDQETKGARVHIKDFHLYIYRKDNHQWYQVLEEGKQPKVWGRMYFSNFKHSDWNHDEGSTIAERTDNGRTVEISVTAGAGLEPGSEAEGKPGFLNHFWWQDHPKIDPYNDTPAKDNTEPSSNVAGIYIVCKARLKGNYTADPGYLIQLGYDYWLPPELSDDRAIYDPEDENGIDDGRGGRAKYVTPEWQYFTFHTFSPEEVKNIRFPGE